MNFSIDLPLSSFILACFQKRCATYDWVFEGPGKGYKQSRRLMKHGRKRTIDGNLE
ncbi:hypothetical protein HMPREF3213_01581 [Heyndrickxia coagulans]|uniref:Uncharacterized protein n=1 Tax=Heyndrickxia coagulans TaxID=1398 RepID=A0A133KTB7_HEYCO|nr:hypothetical protein HMPREF3213_01581 [Heyndrickxia coagulans]